MKADIERWNTKYAARDRDSDPAPDPLLVSYGRLFDGEGCALDVACGFGRNALYLARRGYSVTAVDGSAVALDRAKLTASRAQLAVEFIELDLDEYFPVPESFNAIIVIRFLDRALVVRLKRALRPGGLMLYKTFNRNVLQSKPGFQAEYTLTLGELASMFEDFDTIASNDSPALAEDTTHWIGRKPGRRRDSIQSPC